MNNKFLIVFLFVCFLSACTTIKPYQKMYLNDEDMQVSDKLVEQFDNSFESYREGSSGGHTGKTGGGCGCN